MNQTKRLKVWLGQSGQFTRIELDGVDVSSMFRSVAVRSRPHELSTLSLEVLSTQFEVVGGNYSVTIPPVDTPRPEKDPDEGARLS